MKQNNKIFMHAWLQSHPRTKSMATDRWYLDFANELFLLIDSSLLYVGRRIEDKQQASILLTLYLEDSIANEGGWRRFSELCHQLYGSYLPFYEVPEEYLPDEINEVDVAFLLWKLNSDDGDSATVANPFDEEIWQLASDVYQFMDAVFEQAPICDTPSGDWVLPSEQLLVERTAIPDIIPGIQLPESVRLFLEASGGEQLMYFPLYEQMEDFFVKHLHWNRADIPDKLDADGGNVVVFANPKGLLVAPGVAQFFCDKRNEAAYDKEMAMKEGYRVFTDKGYCPFDLLKYAVERNLFPDARFPFENGKEILQKNWDFIARYFLGEYYEGR
ncbi:DUF3843 family protein [Bacteroides sp.]